ncbi:DciA family protein [Sporomusa aerivorans]|uniref:DciA family protein n=1 Tax=Sporomusa aerivorans TaxID=204936 RepID=UPI00352A77D9
MFRVKDVLSGTLKSMGITKQYNAQSVIVHWQEIAGDEIASHAWPISIQRGVLLLAVNNPVWSHHLMMLKPVIIEKINKFLNEKLVYDIRFQAGNLQKYQNQEEDEENSTKLRPAKLTSDELAAVWQQTEAIQDDSLRKKCYYVLIKQTALTKAKQNDGWQSCKRCNILVPPGQGLCTVCSMEFKKEKTEAITKLLTEAPWLTYQEMLQYVPCNAREFHTAKKRLVHKLIHSLFDPGWDKLNEATLVMLMTGIKPARINQTLVDTVIGKIKMRLAEKVRRKSHVSAPRR